jgi:hypothetical protein
MRVFGLFDKLVEKRVFHVGYLLVLTFNILTYFNGCWINESLTWTPHGWLRKENYWQFYEPTTLINLMYPLLPYSIYVLKKWCAECYLLSVIFTALFWPVLLVNFCDCRSMGQVQEYEEKDTESDRYGHALRAECEVRHSYFSRSGLARQRGSALLA